MSRGGALIGLAGLGVVGALWLTSAVVDFDVVADVRPGLTSAAPSLEHWLGTDHLGRDVWWRLVTGSEAFVGPALLSCAVAAVVGLFAGALAGWTGGRTARGLRSLFSVVGALPRFVLVLLCCAIYGSSAGLIAVVAGLSYAPALGEAIYGRIQAFRQDDFVEAAIAHGVPAWRILGWHLLWVNCRQLVGRHLLNLFGYYLVLETTLSYIGGFGVEEPAPSWGNMLAFEFGIVDGNPWAWMAPAIAIWWTVLAAAISAEGLMERRLG